MTVKIILIRAVTGLGAPGTVKSVSDGYARNFLFPRGLAELATAEKLAKLEANQQELEQKVAENRAKFEELLPKLGKVNLVFKKKATSSGKLFAAVPPLEIAKELSQEINFEVTPDMVVISEPIKSLGEHNIKLVYAPDLLAEFKVTIEK